MTNAPTSARPPRLADWLVDLLAPADRAEFLLGDLNEEYSDIALKSGVASARCWYWRQCGKTVFHLGSASLFRALLSLAGIVILAILVQFTALFPERVTVVILRMQRPYSNLHYGRYIWLLTYGTLIVAVAQTMLIGAIVAVFAKGRELVATTVLGILFGVWTRSPLSVLFVPSAPQLRAVTPLTSFLVSLAANVIATVFAGVIVRRCRPSEAGRPRVT